LVTQDSLYLQQLNNWTTSSHTIACMWSTLLSCSCHTTHLFYKKRYIKNEDSKIHERGV
jgi:hypothetical protein